MYVTALVRREKCPKIIFKHSYLNFKKTLKIGDNKYRIKLKKLISIAILYSKIYF